MMPKLLHRLAAGAAALALLGAAGVASAADQPAQFRMAQATAPAPAPTPAPAKPAAPPKRSHGTWQSHVETHIANLREQLKITDAQAPQWDAFAQVMRDNAAAMHNAIEQRRAKRGKESAVEDLQSYRQIAQTHVDALDKLIPVFQALYATMSPEQQKNADAVFGHAGQHRHHRMHQQG